MTDLNECGNRLNNFYLFGIEAQDTLFNISLNHSSDSIHYLNTGNVFEGFSEVYVSLICSEFIAWGLHTHPPPPLMQY